MVITLLEKEIKEGTASFVLVDQANLIWSIIKKVFCYFNEMKMKTICVNLSRIATVCFKCRVSEKYAFEARINAYDYKENALCFGGFRRQPKRF